MFFDDVRLIDLDSPKSSLLSDKESNWENNASARHDGRIAAAVIKILNTQHLSGEHFDKAMSEAAVKNYLNTLDPNKTYFYSSDIESFLVEAKSLLAKIQNEDVALAFRIYDKFLQRSDEAVNVIIGILDKPIDFTKEENYITDKSSTCYCNNSDEFRDRWSKQIKYDLLKIKASQINLTDTIPVERLKNRYSILRKINYQATKDDILEKFLTSVAKAYDYTSNYKSQSTIKMWEFLMQEKPCGIGADLIQEDGVTIVRGVTPNGPAEKTGLLNVGDQILGIGQGKRASTENIVDHMIEDVVNKLRGKKGSIVRLEIINSDNVKKHIEIKRDSFAFNAGGVQSETFECGKKKNGKPYNIGVVRLNSFYQPCADDVRWVLKDFSEKKIDGVILDLSANGGGSIMETVKTIGLFIESGPVIQHKEGSSRTAKIESDTDMDIEWKGPLVVLRSRYTYTPPLGAIQDYKRGIIVGDLPERSKGTMNKMQDIGEFIAGKDSPNKPEMGRVYFPVSGLYRPSGDSLQGNDVKTDVYIPSANDLFTNTYFESEKYLHLDSISPASSISNFSMTSPEHLKSLQEKSNARIKGNIDFQELQKEIEKHKALKKKGIISLNEKKFNAEISPIQNKVTVHAY